ncbi:hypothetical protein [Ectopseudomonas hydrolytica]|uniref:hypothetical protein n=1 Tax=Ectopseudomonas hydrolytica TaxID=2493633 RepID=UPI0020B72CCA|nr:hypothetical protein [Pseudomonas hydrolytica]UTH30005.1 hypothetical protein NLY38_16360 [Pseudomonas hydrolytica]
MYGLPKRKHAANGGLIVGPGTGTSDSIEKAVPAGTYILPADTTKKLGFGIPGYGGNPKEPPREQPRLGIPRKQVPVAVSNGEYELPPEQVHAIGAALLDQVKETTHKPAGFGLNKAMLAAAKGGAREEPRHFFADGGLVDDEQKPKQTSFDITNTPAAQRAAGIAGDPARAERMQAQFEQPVIGPRDSAGSPASGGRFGLPGYKGAAMSANRPAPAQEAPPDSPAGAVEGAARTQDENGSTAPSQVDQQPGNKWVSAGNGIAMRLGANGAPEFSNDPSALAGAGAMPAGGMSRIGDGVGGGLSVGEPGDAQMAIDRFERANQERQRMIDISRRGEIGEGGGRVTVVRDSSRAPTLAELQNARLDARQTETEAQRQQTQQGAEDYAARRVAEDQRMGTEQLNQQRLRQQIEDGRLSAEDTQRVNHLRAVIADPNASESDRAQARQAYSALQSTTANKPAQMSASIQRLEDDDISAIGSARTMNSELARIDNQIANGELDLGLITNAKSAALNAIGAGDQNARNYASLNSTLEKLRNESLRLNTGVQTEGDAQRAWNELVTNLKSPELVRQRLAEIRALNDRAMGIRQGIINNRRAAQGADPLDVNAVLGTEDAEVTQSRNTPAGRPVAIETDSDYEALPSGSLFVAPDGTTRRKP